MFKRADAGKEWRDGVYLTTATDSFEADIIESKLRSEGIPCLKKFLGAGNFLEITMGASLTNQIDIYVPDTALSDSENIIVAIPLEDDEQIKD